MSSSTGTSSATTKRRAASGATSARPTTTTTPTSTAQPQKTSKISKRMSDRGVWSEEEHDKFLVGIKLYPKGPWKVIAAQVGTRSARQVQTHAQKYYEKVARRLRGLRKDRKKLVRPEHRLDDDMVSLCKVAEFDMSGARLTIGPIGRGLGVHASSMVEAEILKENAALAQAFASFAPSLSSKSVAALETPITKFHVDTSSAPTSPMGIDTVSSVKMQDIDDFVLDMEQEEDDQIQLFMSLLTGNGDNYDTSVTTTNSFDFGDDCSSTTDESLGGDDDDTVSSAGSDDTESIVDLLDDHYLDYLMEVLDTEDTRIYQGNFSCSSYDVCFT